jgi:uncharacterized membrane protein YjjP (DUF1212 family)
MISCAILSRAQSAEIQPNALTMAQGGWFCSVRALVAGGVATVVLLMLLRRGFVSSVASTAVSLFLFSSAVGVVLLPGWCESENFAHIAISHWLLPSILLGVTVVAGVRVSVQVTNYSIGRRRA